MTVIERIKDRLPSLAQHDTTIAHRMVLLVEYYEAAEGYWKAINKELGGIPLARCRTRFQQARARLEEEDG